MRESGDASGASRFLCRENESWEFAKRLRCGAVSHKHMPAANGADSTRQVCTLL